eukprot:11711850-Heterocapsa_arctica.AAC.1
MFRMLGTDSALVPIGSSYKVLEDIGKAEQWLINGDDVSVSTRFLGRGGFGAVLEGTFCSLPVAVKVFDHDRGIDPSCLNELRVLRHLRHPNIVIFLGA